jgi:hypothetical protein
MNFLSIRKVTSRSSDKGNKDDDDQGEDRGRSRSLFGRSSKSKSRSRSRGASSRREPSAEGIRADDYTTDGESENEGPAASRGSGRLPMPSVTPSNAFEDDSDGESEGASSGREGGGPGEFDDEDEFDFDDEDIEREEEVERNTEVRFSSRGFSLLSTSLLIPPPHLRALTGQRLRRHPLRLPLPRRPHRRRSRNRLPRRRSQPPPTYRSLDLYRSVHHSNLDDASFFQWSRSSQSSNWTAGEEEIDEVCCDPQAGAENRTTRV